MDRIAVVGAGLIGRSWAIVFARAGHPVALHDADGEALQRSLGAIDQALGDLKQAGLLEDSPMDVRLRIRAAGSLEDALEGAAYVQENVVETAEAKRVVFRRMDEIASPGTILASSTSFIAASQFTADLPGRSRCLVAHPVNPPYLVPLVELCPAPWTSSETVERTRFLMELVDQVPIVVKKEIPGFILNRLQGAVLSEAMRLYEDGYASAEDIDKTIRNGLGLRWSFMGPFETIDLNAPAGLADYAARYGPVYHEINATQVARPWSAEAIRTLEAERRAKLPAEKIPERSAWRDRRLMALIAHQRQQEG